MLHYYVCRHERTFFKPIEIRSTVFGRQVAAYGPYAIPSGLDTILFALFRVRPSHMPLIRSTPLWTTKHRHRDFPVENHYFSVFFFLNIL